MNTKLTLSLDSKIIEEAKRYSKQKGTSVSKLIEDYLRGIVSTPGKKTPRKSSLMKLKGALGKVPSNFDYKEEIYKYLIDKHT